LFTVTRNMTLDDIPVFATLKSRMNYLADRQQVIAQNVANSDTPGYTPMDLKPFAVPSSGAGVLALAPVAVTLTSAMHIAPPTPAGADPADKPVDSPDSETTLNGNSVVLEEQMIKMGQARTEYDAAVSFYQQSLQLIQSATKLPSGS
jgi:flagellar basal-body rod protein FlgB